MEQHIGILPYNYNEEEYFMLQFSIINRCLCFVTLIIIMQSTVTALNMLGQELILENGLCTKECHVSVYNC